MDPEDTESIVYYWQLGFLENGRFVAGYSNTSGCHNIDVVLSRSTSRCSSLVPAVVGNTFSFWANRRGIYPTILVREVVRLLLRIFVVSKTKHLGRRSVSSW